MRPVLLFAFLLPLPAAAFTAQNGMVARQVSPTEIAVPYESRRPDTDYWCAAGDLATRVMGKPSKTRMWRASPKPRKGSQGILFTLDPAKQAKGAGLSEFGSGPKDGSISLGMAVGNYCRMVEPLWQR